MRTLTQDESNSVLASINGWAPRVIDDYLRIVRDHQGNIYEGSTSNPECRHRALTLANTLDLLAKSSKISIAKIADSLGLPQDEELYYVLDLINTPTNVRPQDYALRGKEDAIRTLIQQRFKAFAEQLCREYNLQELNQTNTVYPRLAPPPYSQQDTVGWPTQQNSYERPQALPLELKQENTCVLLNFNTEINKASDLYKDRKNTLHYLTKSAHAASLGCFKVALFFCVCFSGDDKETNIAALAISAFFMATGVAISLATYAAIAAGFSLTYGLNKLTSSLNKMTHFLQNPAKALRGGLRTGLIVGGTYAAIQQGMLLGAMLGTILPGFGTLIGAIIGGVFGLGLSAFLGKHLIRAVSSLFNFNETNPSNPSRYQLTKVQETKLRNMGVDREQFNALLRKLKKMKADIPFLAKLSPEDTGNQFKGKINTLIEDLKNGLINTNFVSIGSDTFTLFHNHEAKQNAIMRGYHLAYRQPPTYKPVPHIPACQMPA